jgi:hypothetical protein
MSSLQYAHKFCTEVSPSDHEDSVTILHNIFDLITRKPDELVMNIDFHSEAEFLVSHFHVLISMQFA